MIIEGRNSVLEALKANKTFNKLLVNKNSSAENIVSLAREKGIKVTGAINDGIQLQRIPSL